jgi:hypothetical protein
MKVKFNTTKQQPKVEKPSYEEVVSKFKNGDIIGFQTQTQKYRLFTAQGGTICFYSKGSSRRGFMLLESHLEGFRKYNMLKELSDEDAAWKIIDKYRSYAEKASFNNSFIQSCLDLPKTREQWELDGSKSLYDYGVTTGVAKEGDVVTIAGLKKAFRIQPIIDAIKNKTNYDSGRQDFRGYDATVTIKFENGMLRGYLALEYRGTGNGHYYLLINDDCFIYYDKD